VSKSVLQVSTRDEIGLVQKASEFIFRHGGSIISDTVRVVGDRAYLLIYFEADDLSPMHSALEDYRRAVGFEYAVLWDTDATAHQQHSPTVLEVLCRDIKGLLAKQTELIQAHEYTIVSHDGRQTLASEGISEYRQTITLSISPKRLTQETAEGPDGRPMLRWQVFKLQLQQMLEAHGGRFTVLH
jgi:glycine cleavage system regulatory protein